MFPPLLKGKFAEADDQCQPAWASVEMGVPQLDMPEV